MKDIYWRSHDGLRLRAVDYPADGGKTPVICVHGLTRNSSDFEDVAPKIAAGGRRTLAVDVRGRGGSDRDPEPANYHPGIYALDIAGLMEAEGLERAIFVGTSMGGLITMALAAMKPQVVAGAVLNDVGPEISPVGLARIAAYVGEGRPVTNWAEAAAYVKSIGASIFPDADEKVWDVFARRTFREDETGRPVLDYDPAIVKALPIDPEAPPPDMWPLFNALIACGPVLLVRGALSDLIDATIAEKMRQACPTLAYAEVPRVGHAPMLDEPQAWSAIEAFLERAP